MKINSSNLFVFKPQSSLLAIVFISLASLTVSACQKEPDVEPKAVSEVQTTPVTTSIDADKKAEEAARKQQVADDLAAQKEREVNLQELENNIGAAGVTPNAETTTPNPEQAIKGTQITDVTYKSATGDNLSVVFETSATGVLNAIVTLPNKPKMTLSAPEGQGNNPTYRSSDGNIELISHGGGSSIDLMQNSKITNYEATSAEAEVVTQP